MSFHDPIWLFALLGIIPLLAGVFYLSYRLHARRLHTFIAARLRHLLVRSENRGRRVVSLILLSLAVLLLVPCLARPLLHEREEEIERKGVDFMIAIDTSNSMLVRDMAPDHNRLDAAKRAVRELMETLGGDRIGLIAFAGEARILTPMTFNYSTLQLVLDSVDTQTLWRQGTDMSQAIKIAAGSLRKKELDARVLVILSDGDNLTGDALMAAREAKVKDQLTIFTVGLGTRQGAKIPIEKRDEGGNVIETRYIKDLNDEDVVAALKEQPLQSVARITGGQYVRLGARDIDSETPSALAEMYTSEIKPLAESLRVAKIVARDEIFQIPLGIAVALLFAEMLILKRTRRKSIGSSSGLPSAAASPAVNRTAGVLLAVLLCGSGLALAPGRKTEPPRLYIPYSPRPLTVDGNMGEWTSIRAMPLPFMKLDTSSVRLAWREDGLYGIVDAYRGRRDERGSKESKITPWRGDRTVNFNNKQPWNGDCFELFIEKDNKLDHVAGDNDHEVEEYVFLPDEPAGSGLGFWTIPYGLHRTDGIQRAKTFQPGGDTIACAYQRFEGGGYRLEFFVPASLLSPAVMQDRTKITLHFAVKNDGWAVENFAVDGSVNNAFQRPITWRTVYLKPREEKKLDPEKPKDDTPASEKTPPTPPEPKKPQRVPSTPEQRAEALKQAEEFMEKNQPRQALHLLREHLFDRPDDPYLLYNYAITAYADGEFTVAESAWNKVLALNVERLKDKTIFQVGNVTFRQAYALKTTPRSWDNALLLYRRAEEFYGELETAPQDLRDRAGKNRQATRDQIVLIYQARAETHLKEALAIREELDTQTQAKSWRIKQWIDQLVSHGQKAQGDFEALLEIQPDHAVAKKGLAALQELLEFGLLAKARAVRKEVDEAGSTQNQIWTIEKHQEALSYYEQVLNINPENHQAKAEREQIRQATRDVYMKEADIEREMAGRVLKEVANEKRLMQKIQELTGKAGRESLAELTQAETSLRLLRARYPSEDPEEAIKHWINAIEDYDTALTFTPGDPTVIQQRETVHDTLIEFRKTLAKQYLKTAATLPMTNDEEADAVVLKYKGAVRHFQKVSADAPEEAAALRPQIRSAEQELARAYLDRGNIYRKLAAVRRKTHLDRAVAYLQKARQDYVFAYQMDSGLTAAKQSNESITGELTDMRLELSRQIAAMYKEKTEEDDSLADPEIDTSYLRDVTLQEHEKPDDIKKGYENTQDRPDPIGNW